VGTFLDYSFSDLEHLYVHWPFCPYKCHFCDFVAMASHEQFMKDYHHALMREVELFIPYAPVNPYLKTIYLGGGTPSTYPAPLLLDMFAMLRKYFAFDEHTEVTIEVNPGTANKELLQAWHQAGVNRLSIGVQSLKDVVLKSLNRHQTHQQVLVLLQDARELFKNISVDFILGLPGVSDDEWKTMMHDVMSWPINHISIYFLTVHEDTPLYFKVKTNRVSLPPDDALVDLYDWTVEFLAQHGFERYELSNFARAGFESRHNSAYWDRKKYKGFGLGACSFNGLHRFQNTKNLGKYLESLYRNQSVGNESVIETSEQLNMEQIALEKIMLGLRQRKGLCIQDYVQALSPEAESKFFQAVTRLQSMQLIECDQQSIRLTPRGYALENEVTLQLFS
jgi:oxygen-independent coproporphyrinogen-3 oxidase